MAGQYSSKFYASRKLLTRESARIILDRLFEIYHPDTVIDFGCATGTWLSECQNRGVARITGIEGEWVDIQQLEIPTEQFIKHDFSKSKLVIDDRYDLAICIEVAEHLPGEMGDALIDSLVSSSDFVLFSAAVKGQGGTGHVNEQPQSYWAERFDRHGYRCLDMLRPDIWDQDVNVIYKQNMLVFVKEALCKELDIGKYAVNSPYQINRVHPDLLEQRSIFSSERLTMAGMLHTSYQAIKMIVKNKIAALKD